MSAARNAAVASAIFLLGLALRGATWPRVAVESGIMPPEGSDEFYHLRRIWYTFRHFPESLSFDSYVNYPSGGEIIMAPGFDLAIAGLARLLVHTNDQAAVEVVAAWVPPVLGALAAVAAAVIAARVFSPLAGIFAGVLLACLPGHYFLSQVGYVDHHVAVSLGVALLFGAALVVARRPPEQRIGMLSVGLGLGAAALLLTWPGSLLYVALLQGLATVWMIQARSQGIAISRAWQLALAQGVSALALAPAAVGRSWAEYGSFSPLVLSNFQPLWFATTAATCALLAILWGRCTGRAGRRWLIAGAVATPVLVIALVSVPGLGTSLGDAAGWFVEEEENFLANITEIKPLFDSNVPAGQLAAHDRLTRLIYLYPLALAWLFIRAARSRRADLWLIAVWATAHYALTLAQLRFLTSFSVSYVIVLGAAFAALVDAGRRRLATRSWPIRAVALVAVMALLMLALQPGTGLMSSQLSIAWKGPDGAPPTWRLVRARAFYAASRWLRENSPTTSGYLDPSSRPEYGVLAIWDMGHLIRYVAERPMVQDNFGVFGGREQFLAGLAYFLEEEEEKALRIVDRLGVRYVLIDRRGVGLDRRGSADSMMHRLYAGRDARRGGGMTGPALLEMSPLRRHRLVMETSLAQLSFPHVMLYQIVEGARIQGRSQPGATLQLSLHVRSSRRLSEFLYRAETLVEPDGRYSFLVPYATGVSDTIRTGKSYSLHCGGQAASVTVSEAAVIEGKTVNGPSVRCITEKL